MGTRAWLGMVVLAGSLAPAAAPGFLLAMDYTEWGPVARTGVGEPMTADSSDNLYILTGCAGITGGTCMTKLSADGKTILWQRSLGYPNSVAVGNDGSVYLLAGEEFQLVAQKLASDGRTVLWTTVLGANLPCGGMAVDSGGRMFVAEGVPASAGSSGSCTMVRLDAAGAVDATFPGLPGQLYAVDAAGSTALAGGNGCLFLLAAEGTWNPVTLQQPLAAVSQAAVLPGGGLVVYGTGQDGNTYLQRVDAAGAAVFTLKNPGAAAMTLDAAGNIYLIGYAGPYLHPVKNSTAGCGTTWLSVLAADGSVLQTTYIPGGTFEGGYSGAIAVSPNSVVYVLDSAEGLTGPAQIGPFLEYPEGFALGESAALIRLSQNAAAPVFALACIGSSATLATGPVSAGELVTLFGSGLGPPQGVATTATPQTPYPTQAGDVQVTFDGEPAPLLWVQDAQINVVVPWSVAGRLMEDAPGRATQVCVIYRNTPANCLGAPVVEASPAVFMADGTYAIAINQDGRPNSAANPAPLDSTVTVFATGLGPLNPPQADGALLEPPLPANTLPVQLLLPLCMDAGLVCIPSPIYYTPVSAGPAQNTVAGVSAIVFHASDAVNEQVGLQVEVQGTAGPFDSNAFRIYVAGQ